MFACFYVHAVIACLVWNLLKRCSWKSTNGLGWDWSIQQTIQNFGSNYWEQQARILSLTFPMTVSNPSCRKFKPVLILNHWLLLPMVICQLRCEVRISAFRCQSSIPGGAAQHQNRAHAELAPRGGRRKLTAAHWVCLSWDPPLIEFSDNRNTSGSFLCQSPEPDIEWAHIIVAVRP